MNTQSEKLLCIPAAAAGAVNPIGIKMILAYVLSTFFNKRKPVFSNGLRSVPRNPPNRTFLDNWVGDNFILAD